MTASSSHIPLPPPSDEMLPDMSALGSSGERAAPDLLGLGLGGGGVPGSPGGAPGDLGDDDPFVRLFGRMMQGMGGPGGPGGAADGGAAGGEGGEEEGPAVGGFPGQGFEAMLQQQLMAMMGGMGGGEGGPEGMAELAAAMGGMGMGGSGAPSGSAAGAAAAGAGADEDDALASSRLSGLAKQTLKTVSKQAKKTRGHAPVGRGAGGPPGSVAGIGGAGLGGAGLGGAGGPLGGLGALLGAMGAGGGAGAEGGGGGTGPGVNMMVDYIMQQLLSKDVLYGPLKVGREGMVVWGCWSLRFGVRDAPRVSCSAALGYEGVGAQDACALACW